MVDSCLIPALRCRIPAAIGVVVAVGSSEIKVNSMNKGLLFGTAALLAFSVATGAGAAGFTNGGFETGDASGWTQGGGYRGGVYNNNLDPADFVPGDGGSRSSIIAAGTVDPVVGAALGTTVLNGNYSYRVQDTTYGGYASVLQQRVNGYSDANIYFAWKAVLEGAHGTNDSATMIIKLTDLTTNTDLITRQYNAASSGGGVDPRFSLANDYFYTPKWQVEQLGIDQSLFGHDFLLSVLAADCQPTGHRGYVYIDGFGSVTPPGSAVPEPATWAMMIAGFGGAGVALRSSRRRRSAMALA